MIQQHEKCVLVFTRMAAKAVKFCCPRWGGRLVEDKERYFGGRLYVHERAPLWFFFTTKDTKSTKE